MDTSKIGRFIAENRKKKNMTQQEVADLLEVSFKTISRWETGRHMPDLSMLIPLSEILEVSVHELLLGEYIEERDLKMKTEKSMETVVALSKQETRKRDVLYVVVLGLVTSMIVLLMGFAPLLMKGNTDNVTYAINETTKVSQNEVELAMDLACEHFEIMNNCELKALSYHENNYQNETLYWEALNKEHPNEKVIVLGSIFEVGKLGGPSYLEKGKTYMDYYYVVILFEGGKEGTVLYYGNRNVEDYS